MIFLKNVLKVIFLLMIALQIGTSEIIRLTSGASFEATLDKTKDGFHIFQVSKEEITHIEYGTPDYVQFVNQTDISTKVLKFVENIYYLKIKSNKIASSSANHSSPPATSKEIPVPSEFLFKMHGSNTIGAKLAPTLVSAYLQEIGATNITITEIAKEHKEIKATLSNGKETKVEIQSHGSSTGFKDLNASRCDIAMSSRRVKEKERKTLKRFCAMQSVKHEHIIAIDGVAIFVNQKNPVFRLSIPQIKDIYTGKIKDWSEVGGKKGKINLYARDNNSGTWDTFNSLILNNEPLYHTVKRYEDNTILSQNVSKDINGIGFGGLPYILDTKELAISDGKMTVKPDRFTVATEDYPLSRRLYLYSTRSTSQPINDFIEFVLSSKGQDIVNDVNFINLNIKEFKPIITDKMPLDYKKLAKNLIRLSTNFRFEGSSSRNLDNKAQRDLNRVVKYLKDNQINGESIFLVGFTDNIGAKELNKDLSKRRAKSVLYALKSKNIVPKIDHLVALGEDYPIANNFDEKGRSKNRRVEIWVKK